MECLQKYLANDYEVVDGHTSRTEHFDAVVYIVWKFALSTHLSKTQDDLNIPMSSRFMGPPRILQ